MSLINHHKIEPQAESDDMYYENTDTTRSLRPIPKARTTVVHTGNVQDAPPGVILLGRGNSFSLGRSEVIFLHKSKGEKSKANDGEVKRTQSLDARANHIHEQHLESDTSLYALSPPPISNGECKHMIIGQRLEETRLADDVGLDFEERSDLDILWDKVESVMFAKQAAVQTVLEDFGIGDIGGGEEHGLEEENIWQVVEENFCV